MTSDIELYRKFMRVSHALRHGHSNPALKVAPGQQRVLVTLAESGDIPQRDLISAMGLAPASMSELLTKLEEKGLVERVKSSTDRRITNVALTDDGKRQANELIEAQSLAAKNVFSKLSDVERTEFVRLLDVLQ